ncbi:cysteine-rich receptor-like protein kinase 37 isoform X3 [Arabidopsis lyrata subsp. lyrata]|uniref:cysteine-rich receptor-like protein kinase 37 isoform X3 n=1 Tax=Arabidopsis lyrata subsp. lyrata TaxID=81972 RepID=UPI000A29E369|nr:cysteine-rich receptor-like protein kinase 37 isoform X3 [Arabidopsis lyrata subsp. lyrata]|eukprot:XP_020877650.1 cysteine-rich receptor-like protein kinase 37 isoform X3 [Arabidopsis lyrata subsp. lyrata]
MGKSGVVTSSLSLLLFFLQTLKYVHAGSICYGDFFNVNYGVSRNYLFSSLPSNVVDNGGFYNASFGRDSKNNRVHVVALCRRGYEEQACKTCLEHVIEDTKAKCPRQKESFSWVTDEFDDVSCSLRYTNHSTLGKLELLPSTINPNPNSIDSKFNNMTMFSQEWIAMVNRTLEAASTVETSSVLKYYSATRTEFTQISDVYALMQCVPDLSPGNCKRCLRECVNDFQKQYWGRQGGGISRPSCYFRWDLYPFYRAFENVTRVPAPPPQASSTILDYGRDKQSFQGSNIAIIVVPTVINLFIFVVLIFSWKRRKPSHTGINEALDGQSMLRFDLRMILTATNNFSLENKLGQGGFGSVYKVKKLGILPSGQEIAVKRLTKGSGQGGMEFKNEVLLLTRLQHRNLVKLLGFCNEKDEEILVYEFVPNSSLDHFIFDEEKRRLLTWDVRYRIIEGVARGLLYLHEDSQLRIIHRDLKASNILLDAEMNPKVADFGMARLFDMDETRGQTSRVVGTYGYMAPEYATYGQFSAKSDVYSFGVMLLEMISGKSNKNLEKEEEEEEELPAFVWKRWLEGRFAEIIDPLAVLSNNISMNQVMKLIHIGLLCIQENVSKRPSINSILFWLERHATTTMPVPTPVAYLTRPSPSQSSSLCR